MELTDLEGRIFGHAQWERIGGKVRWWGTGELADSMEVGGVEQRPSGYVCMTVSRGGKPLGLLYATSQEVLDRTLAEEREWEAARSSPASDMLRPDGAWPWWGALLDRTPATGGWNEPEHRELSHATPREALCDIAWAVRDGRAPAVPGVMGSEMLIAKIQALIDNVPRSVGFRARRILAEYGGRAYLRDVDAMIDGDVDTLASMTELRKRLSGRPGLEAQAYVLRGSVHFGIEDRA